ncbi:MAG TPA: RNA-guided endonuclease InsQ/TnpB family protein [Xenococcaceae cyanobacterium]
MYKVVKIRLYPNIQQQQALSQAFGNCRWLWNYCLNLMNQTYKDTGKGLSGYAVKKQIPQLKKEHEWLKLTYSQCLQQVCLNLGVAFNNFFERRAKYPRFKSKHGKQSIHYPQNVEKIDSCLRLPKIGDVKAVFHRSIEGKFKTVTVSKNQAGQYFAAILFNDGVNKPKVTNKGKAIGIDLGLTHFAITSEGSKFDNPRWINKHEKNLKIKQQQLSRKQKGSNNKNKSRKKVAKVHLKIANCRSDFHHKLSRRIVNESKVICVESLAVANLVKNRKLSKAISQVGWGQFCTMLKYKAEQEGKTYVEVDRFFASSKTCNVCLNQVDSLSLEIRTWTCSNCNTKHDRDINASICIRDEGLRILKSLTSGTGDKADRQTVRRSNRGRKKSTTTLVSG